jgi:hypothetical protein
MRTEDRLEIKKWKGGYCREYENRYYCLSFTYNIRTERIEMYRVGSDNPWADYEEVDGYPPTHVLTEFVLPPDIYLIVYVKFKDRPLSGLIPLSKASIVPSSAEIKKIKVVDKDNIEVLEVWSCDGETCKEFTNMFKKMRER